MHPDAIITSIGLDKLARATLQKPLFIKYLALGDGGADGNAALMPTMTALANEKWRGAASPPIRDPLVTAAQVILFASQESGSGRPLSCKASPCSGKCTQCETENSGLGRTCM